MQITGGKVQIFNPDFWAESGMVSFLSNQAKLGKIDHFKWQTISDGVLKILLI